MTGDEIRNARRDAGLHQSELAKRAGVSEATVYRAERCRDKMAWIGPSSLAKIRSAIETLRADGK